MNDYSLIDDGNHREQENIIATYYNELLSDVSDIPQIIKSPSYFSKMLL